MCPSLHVRVFMYVLAGGVLTLLGWVLLGILVPNDLFWNCKAEDSSCSITGWKEAWNNNNKVDLFGSIVPSLTLRSKKMIVLFFCFCLLHMVRHAHFE